MYRPPAIACIVLAGFPLMIGSSGCAPPTSAGGESERSGLIEAGIAPTEKLAAAPALLDLGRQTYERQCLSCHGASGNGEGEAAYLLYPRPRDFTEGYYRLVSTWEGAPTDEDLYRSISRGMPGSAMPSWAHLSTEEKWGLVHYVKSLARSPWTEPPASAPKVAGDVGTGVIQVPPQPDDTPENRQRAARLFADGCAACHGPEGRGDGQQEQHDSKGIPTRPRDLTAGVFKGVPDPETVYRRVIAGLPGSPMPASAHLHGDDGWLLARLVLSMSSEEQRTRVEMKRFRIVARRTVELPSHPDAKAWEQVESVDLHLMPLWWRPERPETVNVRAMHDGRELSLLMVWSDASRDHTAIRPQDFRDAAAVQFSPAPDPPFFAMGQRGAPVNIWMWKAERQADLETAFQDIDRLYPNLGIDSYPNLLRSPLEQPARHALTLQSDPTYVTAWGAGNIVADPTRRSAVEDLTAQGFGTLRARPRPDQKVETVGNHATGSYRVQFRRSMAASGEGSVPLTPGSRVPLAFAVWNGTAGDRDGKKSVTIWQELFIAP